MKRKKYKGNLLTPDKYWEMKLGIKHYVEVTRYKKLCNYKLSKKELESLDGLFHTTYSQWKEYMESKLSVLNQDELYEYSKYINGNIAVENVFGELFYNLMMPLSVSIVSSVLINTITDSVLQYAKDVVENPIYALAMLLFYFVACGVFIFWVFKIIVKNAKENKVIHLFYKDMYELVTSKLQQ